MDSPALISAVKELFEEALAVVVPAGIPTQLAMVAPTDQKNAQLGDYQCNNAMALFGMCKKLGADNPFKSPRAVAEAILAALPENELIKKTDIAGPGFINVTLNDSLLATTAAPIRWNCVQ